MSDDDGDCTGGGARGPCGHARGDGEATVTTMVLMDTRNSALDITYLDNERCVVPMLRPSWSQC